MNFYSSTRKQQKEKWRKQSHLQLNQRSKIHRKKSKTKEVKELYSENYKTLMKEIEEDIKKWKDIPCSGIRRTNIVKMSIIPKLTCTFNVIPIQIPIEVFTELEQQILKFVWNHKRPWIAKATLGRKSKARGIKVPFRKL